MRRHKLEKSSALGKKIINQLIVDRRKTMLSKATTTTQLWFMIKKSDNWGKKLLSSIDSYSASAGL